jgi:hypothetical protein
MEILYSLIDSCQLHGRPYGLFEGSAHPLVAHDHSRRSPRPHSSDVATGYVVVLISLVTIATFVMVIIKISHVGPRAALYTARDRPTAWPFRLEPDLCPRSRHYVQVILLLSN